MPSGDRVGRGPVATEDMRRRIAAGWTVDQLYDRMLEAEFGEVGYVYDYAEPVAANTEA